LGEDLGEFLLKYDSCSGDEQCFAGKRSSILTDLTGICENLDEDSSRNVNGNGILGIGKGSLPLLDPNFLDAAIDDFNLANPNDGVNGSDLITKILENIELLVSNDLIGIVEKACNGVDLTDEECGIALSVLPD
jgi:hypothetical protein